ncbi:ER membrane complex subunit 3 [Puccinia graminis f. sp. tritici]|uniref:ER membrane protein complex subunit 3 n=4 Tax=Puccinia graminis f. sp. tritici TaxID=56615 RepID=E3KZ64_PUCGT|nr:uncharacterized protein PGTG_15738 [Puccinia graminis f. sp. tritici CRL 75-36-700-3]XP_003336473.1 uncharacterized protein PGTG_18144 [Puccinia graminis f. sp. tritici CRL 75-36-700-3]KAA1072555.1 ER membrane complex subunit 3 [Puccinia graminis f. sp. tritici]EFP89589.1 hypothetical protein PGTG_15738 [Puccinia graminis f. sp. tritici CRL 75-36-700-3]EFP92054.1 hypothetical protein PGTG_18144 [Puccinia graminis f. sp. tritici CRL 75-36-700-3]KAA1074411.1 ER membrane complex subunit 3 [Puc
MSTWAEQDIRLDPAIRNWVLLPITFVMLLVGILRHYAMQLLHSDPKPIGLKQLREQRALMRSGYFRNNCHFLSPSRFEERRNRLINAFLDGHYLSETGKPQSKSVITDPNNPKSAGNQDELPPANPPNPLDPANMEGMMDGMKKQMVMMIPQTVIMGWINAFFFGFVCVKLPFPLPNGFKQMLQRGIETRDMDISWVSSLSWYFLNLFGLNPLYRLILGDGNAADGTASLAMGGASNMAAVMPGQQVDYKKLYQTEVENLKLVDHQYVCDPIVNLQLDDIETRILKMYKN